MKRSLSVAALAATALLTGAAPAWADHDRFTPGSSGLGDPLYPLAGNGGYDVRHYSIEIDYDRATNHIDSEAGSRPARPRTSSSFNLDLRGFEIPRARGERARRGVHARRPGADGHPQPRVRARPEVRGRDRVRGDARARSSTRTAAARAGCPTERRRLRRQRAAGLARLVPGERQPAGQGDLRLRGHRAGGHHRDRQRQPACRERTRAARRHGTGTRTRRWRRT